MLGTVRDVANSTGHRANHIDFSSFGQPILQMTPGFANRYLFTGREYDWQFAQYFFRARFVDPARGAFTSPDPLEYHSGDANFYRYVGNSPLNASNPLGHMSFTETALIVTALAFAYAPVVGVYCIYKLGPDAPSSERLGTFVSSVFAFPISAYFAIMTFSLNYSHFANIVVAVWTGGGVCPPRLPADARPMA